MSCDTKAFEELINTLENEQSRIDDFCKDCSIRIVSEIFKKAAKRSPVDTGALRRGFTITDNLEISAIHLRQVLLIILRMPIMLSSDTE